MSLSAKTVRILYTETKTSQPFNTTASRDNGGTIVSGNQVDEKNAVAVKRKRASRLVAYSFVHHFLRDSQEEKNEKKERKERATRKKRQSEKKRKNCLPTHRVDNIKLS